ncbi:MAG: hypothetical protein DRN17_00040 [Thermoplasmata archaeon]|nr:MAG: hypothetical protein DRN17_00040 [Thermoplasmata archaeon]
MRGRPKTKDRSPVIVNLDKDIKILAKAHGIKNFSDWINSIAKIALSSNSVEQLEAKKQELQFQIMAIEAQIENLEQQQIQNAELEMHIEQTKQKLLDWAERRLASGYGLNMAWLTGRTGKEFMKALGWTPKQTLEFLKNELEVIK